MWDVMVTGKWSAPDLPDTRCLVPSVNSAEIHAFNYGTYY